MTLHSVLQTILQNLNPLSSLEWREPLWLLLMLQPVLLIIIRKFIRRKHYTAYADATLLPWVMIKQNSHFLRRLRSKNTAYILAWLLFAIAAAGPRAPLTEYGVDQSDMASIMLVVDLSSSMRAADIYPNRLRRVQLEVHELLERARGYRVGIVVFAARAHVYTPLTSDREALTFYLEQLHSLQLPTDGSRPAEGIKLALEQLATVAGNKSIILVSDGDFTGDDDPAYTGLLNTIDVLNRSSIPLYILGAGTVEGDAIPIAEGWLQYNGRAVIPRMDQNRLQYVAASTHAAYSAIMDDNSEWQIIFDHGIAMQSDLSLSQPEQHRRWQEYFHWPLAVAVILIWLAMLPYAISTHFTRFTIHSVKVIPIVILALMSITEDAYAELEERQAYQKYKGQDYISSMQLYQNIPGYNGRFGEAASLYQLQDYVGASSVFSQAILAAPDDIARASSLYNLGNSYFMQGDYATAIRVYKDALLYQPDHPGSLANLSFSESLQEVVEARLRNDSTSRAGSGPRRAAPNALIEPTERSSLSIDETEQKQKTVLPLPRLPGNNDVDFETLIERGLAFIRLAADDSASNAKNKRNFNISTAYTSQRQRIEIEEQQSLLWKRLFELEEGFEAPVDSPKTVPGVLPW